MFFLLPLTLFTLSIFVDISHPCLRIVKVINKLTNIVKFLCCAIDINYPQFIKNSITQGDCHEDRNQ